MQPKISFSFFSQDGRNHSKIRKISPWNPRTHFKNKITQSLSRWEITD
jgi:hypothetical protein